PARKQSISEPEHGLLDDLAQEDTADDRSDDRQRRLRQPLERRVMAEVAVLEQLGDGRDAEVEMPKVDGVAEKSHGAEEAGDGRLEEPPQPAVARRVRAGDDDRAVAEIEHGEAYCVDERRRLELEKTHGRDERNADGEERQGSRADGEEDGAIEVVEVTEEYAEKQTVDPEVRGEHMHAGGVRVVEERQAQRETDRGDDRSDDRNEPQGPLARADAEGDADGNGDHEIEVLLDGEAPRVSRVGEVVLQVKDPGEHARERRPEVAVRVDEGVLQEITGEKHVIRRPDLEPPAEKEPAHVDPIVGAQLLEQEAADEKAAEDEEQIDPRPADAAPDQRDRSHPAVSAGRGLHVPADDEEDRHRAEDVELDRTTRPCGRRAARRRGRRFDGRLHATRG